MKSFLVFLSLCLAAAAIAFATHGRHWQLPDRHNPFVPLAISDAPNWLTRHKLARLERDPAECLAVLGRATMKFEPLPDRTTGPQCGFTNAVRVTATSFSIGPAFSLSCRAAVSLALWERHVVAPEAARILGAPVTRIDHFGSYACRNVYGREAGNRSQHATADALDVAGFVLGDGRRITVASHWGDRDAAADAVRKEDPRAVFLHAVHAGGCRFFDGVLGPEYNAAHADHLHLDRGRYRICR